MSGAVVSAATVTRGGRKAKDRGATVQVRTPYAAFRTTRAIPIAVEYPAHL